MGSFGEKRWTVRGPFGELEISFGFDTEGEEALGSAESELGWLAYGFRSREPGARRALLEVYAELTGHSPTRILQDPAFDFPLDSPLAEAIADHVVRAARRGQLVVRRRETPAGVAVVAAPEAPVNSARGTTAPADQFVRIALLDASGVPWAPPGSQVKVTTTPDGTAYSKPLAGGSAEVTAIPAAAASKCSLVFSGVAEGDEVVPESADPVQSYPGARLALRHQLTKDRSLDGALNQTNVIQLQRRAASVVELEHFADGGALLWPGEPPATVTLNDGVAAVRGIDALRAALGIVQGVAIDHVLVAGHDASVSQERADAIAACLVGDAAGRAKWADVAVGKGTTADQQAIMRWAASEFGWRCDPGDIDGVSGPHTEAGVRGFQRAYNADQVAGLFPTASPDGPLAVDGIVGHFTYGAIFDCIQRALLGTPQAPTGLQSMPSPGPSANGCGDHHEASPFAGAEGRRAVDRHVEVVVLGASDPVPIVCKAGGPSPCTASVCELYDPREFTVAYVPPEGGDAARVQWTSWHKPYDTRVDDLRLALLDEGNNVLATVPVAPDLGVSDAVAFDLTPHAPLLPRALFAQLVASAGTALEYPIPMSVVAANQLGAATATGIDLEIELVARLADGTASQQCSFQIKVGAQDPITASPGLQRVSVAAGDTIQIQAHGSDPDRWDLDDAVMAVQVIDATQVQILVRHPDFKPPIVTNAASPSRLGCEYFLSRLKDFTAEAQHTIATGDPDGKLMTNTGDFIPADHAERPAGLGQPVPTFGPYRIDGSTLARAAASYSPTQARLVEIKKGAGPVLGSDPRVVGLCWNTSDTSNPGKDFASGGMDTLVFFSIPSHHQDYLNAPGEDGHQHSFDYLWMYPYWWMNYYRVPTVEFEQADPAKKVTTDYPSAGAEGDPMSFLGRFQRFRAGAGALHQVAATARPIMSLFPITGLHGATSEWNSGAAFSEFLYELVAMLRRQAGDYRPLAKGDHLKRIGVAGHSEACTAEVLPKAMSWAASGPLHPHLADAIFLDPAEGSMASLTTKLKAWAGQHGGSVRTCIATKAPGYVTNLGGAMPPHGVQYQVLSHGSAVHPAPLRFVFVSAAAWQARWTEVVTPQMQKEHGLAWVLDDAHECACYFSIHQCLVDSPLGT
jgi:hypothetical protein